MAWIRVIQRPGDGTAPLESMPRSTGLLPIIAPLLGILLLSCRPDTPPRVRLESPAAEVEVEGELPLSAYASAPGNRIPIMRWRAERGEIRESSVTGEVDYLAPRQSGPDTVTLSVTLGDKEYTEELEIAVLEDGALETTALVLVQVDTATLRDVYVNPSYPGENFVAPLMIKGTFRYDPETGEAWAGGSWPNYTMYDDGTHGDEAAGDGIWSILFRFEKSDQKVYFAFDDAAPYRVQYESGVTWRMKTAWIGLDDFPMDDDNPAFIPDGDKTLIWDAAMARKGGIHSPPP